MDKVIELIKARSGIPPEFGASDRPTEVWTQELGWRVKGALRFQAWLDKPETTADIGNPFGLFPNEFQDLGACLNHPANAARRVGLVDLLRRIRKPDPHVDRPETLMELHAILLSMEEVARAAPHGKLKIVNGCANKWTVLTALLAFANPDFPTIRHGSQNPRTGEAPAHLFADIDWQSQPSRAQYTKYCARFDLLEEILATKGLGDNPLRRLGVSAWTVAAEGLVKPRATHHAVVELLKQGAVILQGPPGTGKTHLAERIGATLAGEGSILVLDQFERDPTSPGVKVVTHFVQFHASYDYEDFVRGFRPSVAGNTVGFELTDGPFVRMVSWALCRPDVQFLLVVDEINRADIARVLGECIYLLDRRVSGKNSERVRTGQDPGAVTLRYVPAAPVAAAKDYAPGQGRLLSRIWHPDNLLLVATMNTADRSVAIVDTALRRRFFFVDVTPDPRIVAELGQQFKHSKEHIATFQGWMRVLNEGEEEGGHPLIREQSYRVGHSYFCKPTLAALRASIHHQLLPLLDEYQRDRRLEGEPEDIERLLEEMRRFPDVA